MIDIKIIREYSQQIKEGAKKKRITVDIDRLLELDREIRPLQTELENCQAERNRLSKMIPQASGSERENLKSKVQDIKRVMDSLEERLTGLRAEFEHFMLLVPQPPRSDVPVGKDDSENVEVKRWGEPPKFGFDCLDHIKICERHKLADFPRGVKLSGSRSYVLTGLGARLEQAVMRLTYDRLIHKRYNPMSIPVLVREDAMTGTGYFPVGREQAYCVEKDELALVGTAEVSLTSFFANEILPESDLPIRMMAWSNCFRREAGTYGKDTSGFYRVHQFQKVEQVIVAPAHAEISERLHAELVANAEEILQLLELPYRIVYVCTGDLGQGQIRKHDIETWMPSRNGYCETHSCSTFHDFQARRLKIRYKDGAGEVRHCYTLNNTAIASPRILIPLLECHQQKDGSVRIPRALQPYLDGIEKISV